MWNSSAFYFTSYVSAWVMGEELKNNINSQPEIEKFLNNFSTFLSEDEIEDIKSEWWSENDQKETVCQI